MVDTVPRKSDFYQVGHALSCSPGFYDPCALFLHPSWSLRVDGGFPVRVVSHLFGSILILAFPHTTISASLINFAHARHSYPTEEMPVNVQRPRSSAQVSRMTKRSFSKSRYVCMTTRTQQSSSNRMDFTRFGDD